MTGGEIVAASKAVEAVGAKTFGDDEKTKDVLLRVGEGTPEMKVAARTMARRVAVVQGIKLKMLKPIASSSALTTLTLTTPCGES